MATNEIARRPGRSHPPSLLRLAERLVREERLIERGDVVLCACSGGPDSTALLSVLARLRGRFGFEVVAHGVDHGLRAEAGGELGCAERAAGALRVPFATTRVRLEPGGNVQARARAARAAALGAAARAAGARLVATGHTADDRAETFLLRLLRGAGPRGLAVLPPSAPFWLRDAPAGDATGGEAVVTAARGAAEDGHGHVAAQKTANKRALPSTASARAPDAAGSESAPNSEAAACGDAGEMETGGEEPGGARGGAITLIRPLLLARRVDVEAHLLRHGLEAARDPSNRDARFLRARVRHELLPLMEEISPGIAEHLCALADMIGEGAGYGEELSGLGIEAAGRAQKLAFARAKKCERAVNLLLAGGREVTVGFSAGKAVLMKGPHPGGPRRAGR